MYSSLKSPYFSSFKQPPSLNYDPSKLTFYYTIENILGHVAIYSSFISALFFS